MCHEIASLDFFPQHLKNIKKKQKLHCGLCRWYVVFGLQAIICQTPNLEERRMNQARERGRSWIVLDELLFEIYVGNSGGGVSYTTEKCGSVPRKHF